ncbi:MAG TPA: DUF1707 domain-containing protein [Tessaracoccus flavescens]|uniref:DUF1707 domain-containing protein n=1 Tax=Tessaracoccus flavescens TaxID=399497 RepID=A0A921JQH6_9ACTN|nr:DUF1707 domain-containing protein [Tessaracoccus flavescens]
MSELRASFEERDRYLKQLSKHYAEGRLDEAEFEQRSDAIVSAVTHRDAMLQFEGLPKPNIVSVQGYQPPAGPRYEPQPYKEDLPGKRPEPQPVNRRGLLMVGGLAVGVVGLIGAANIVGRGSSQDFTTIEPNFIPDMYATAADEVPSDYFEPTSAMWDVVSALQERGLDHVSSLSMADRVITGTALSLRSPGVVTTFTRPAEHSGIGSPVTLDAVTETEVANSTPVDQLGNAVMESFDRVHMDLMPADTNALSFALEFRDGSPVYKWTDTTGAYAVYNVFMELVELKR